MGYWIDKLGFWGYIKQFPLNPITIVGTVVLIGIIVLIINGTVRKNKAKNFLAENPNSAIMTFYKKKVGNFDYADNIRLVKLNDEIPKWFFLKPTIPAIYLQPGENTLVLYTEWARQGGGSIKNFKSSVKTITLSAESNGQYSLEYYIPSGEYIFEKYDNPKLFGE